MNARLLRELQDRGRIVYRSFRAVAVDALKRSRASGKRRHAPQDEDTSTSSSSEAMRSRIAEKAAT